MIEEEEKNYFELSNWAEDSAYNIVQDLAIGFQKSQILFTAVKYDVFSIIHCGVKTAESLAKTLNVNQKSLERLLNALVSIKLLTKREVYYENTQISEKHLLRTSPDYFGFLLHNADLWESWGTLSEVVKTGINVTNQPLFEKSKSFIYDFLLAYDWKAKLEMSVIYNKIPLANTKKFLKFGAISSRYAFEIAKQNPEMEVIIADYPNIIDAAEIITRNEYHCKNLSFLKCNLNENYLSENDPEKSNLGTDYNTIFVDQIIEEYSVLENITMLKNIYNSLARRGKLVIHQLIISDERTDPKNAALQSVNLLLNTTAGDSYTHSDIWVVLKEAGFGEIEFIKTEASSQIIIASKSLIG
jgi:DNA-binding HxlR family transcriptional regulator